MATGSTQTEQVAEFAASLTFGDLPEDVVHSARRSILDWLGVSLAGMPHATARGALGTMRAIGGSGRSTVVGELQGMSAYAATVVNGVYAHVLDWDDSIYPTRMHAGAFLLPPLMAQGEDQDASGRELIAGFVVGFEIAQRLMLAMYPAYGVKRWHGGGIAGAAAAGAAVGRLLDLNRVEMAHAIGLGAGGGAGTLHALGTSAKSLIMGHAGASGLQAAHLASHGWTAPPDMIGAGGGFLTMYDEQPRYETVVHGLGSRWYVLDNGFKPYPCGMVAHAAIDAVLALRDRAPADAQLTSMILRVPPETMSMMGDPDPQTGLQGKFSARYAAAVAWVDGDVGPAAFEDDAVSRSDYQLARRAITMEVDEGMTQYEASGEARTLDGWHHSIAIPYARGIAQNPLSDSELQEKFLQACAIGGYDRGEELAALAMHADEVPIRELTAMLR
ncbi:MAG: MmgE/PrpD family protein [Dehalococcoidia bacterium]